MNKVDQDESSRRLTVTLPESFAKQLRALSKRKRVSTAWIVREAIRVYLENEKPLFVVRPD